jgi:hypothetical protein
MKLSKSWLNRIEGIGLVLILFSFFVQSFQNDSESSFRESQNYHLNKKLDHIWIRIGNQSSETVNLKSAHKDWEFYSKQFKELESWENKIELFEQLGTWIFVIGTVMVIAPKFIDEKEPVSE